MQSQRIEGEEWRIPTAAVFMPLDEPSRYKGAHGGRGSGKSHYFAEKVVERCVETPGLRVVCIREIQKSLKESAKKLIEDKIEAHQAPGFRVKENEIITPGNGVIIFQGMQDHTADSIKSLEGFDIAWVEEAQSLSERSLQLLRPTIRAPGSELWFSWNPRYETDPVDRLLRKRTPSDAIVVQANWADNPWWPDELERERQDDYANEPDQYDHVWEGDYITVAKGAYYRKHLRTARAEGRVGRVGRDELMPVKVYADIGGTGGKSDAFTFWVAQHIGKEIRLINYYEVIGQPIAHHVAWLNMNGYEPDGMTEIWLPHDGATNDRVYAVSYESEFAALGYRVNVIKNQGVGAANMRIAAARRIFPRCWFDEERCEAGLKALGWYHEKWDEDRNVGLGPEHDWSSHGSDGFGLMGIAYEEPRTVAGTHTELRARRKSSWRH